MATNTSMLSLFVKNVCVNCVAYGWKQAEGKITLRCGGCKTFYYCSRDCQEEHWKKTHRQHCKHLANLAGQVHDKESCKDCILQASEGRKIFKANNPIYFCTSVNNPELEALSSVATDPGDRSERAIKAMQRLLVKMQLTKHPGCTLFDIEKLKSDLEALRVEIYARRLQNPKMATLSLSSPVSLPISAEFSSERDIFKTWDTFKTLCNIFSFLVETRGDQLLKSPEKSLSAKWRLASKKMREGPFLLLVDQILEALEEQVVPHCKLVEIVCQGNLEQNCMVCEKKIVVTRIWSPKGKPTVPAAATVCFFPSEGVTFSCGSADCEEKRQDRISAMLWGAVLSSTVTKLENTRCDICFLCAPVGEVHRSKCKTKYYCSKTCRRADEDVHKGCCKEGNQVDERKVKIGGKEKVEVAVASQKEFVSNRVALLERGVKSRCCDEMLKLETAQLKKMNLKEAQKLGGGAHEVD